MRECRANWPPGVEFSLPRQSPGRRFVNLAFRARERRRGGSNRALRAASGAAKVARGVFRGGPGPSAAGWGGILMHRSVLITGGTGSFGRTFLGRLLETGAEEVRIFSRDEEKQDALRHAVADPRVRFHIGDVRDAESIRRAIKGVDAVFHAAALKQVPSCEFFPIEAIRTNVLGSENVIRAAIEAGVSRVTCLSTDKAVFPINAMGMSKALMEKVAQAAARELGEGADTTIAMVRYGNVMFSRGSVIPLFLAQIRAGRPITMTDPRMTRFLMPLSASVELVEFAMSEARQGDLFVKKSPASTIADLAEAMRRVFGAPDHPVETIGWRHGEKLYETLASAAERAAADDMGGYYRIPLDTRSLNYAKYFEEGSAAVAEVEDYHSHNTERLDVAGVAAMLESLPDVQRELGR